MQFTSPLLKSHHDGLKQSSAKLIYAYASWTTTVPLPLVVWSSAMETKEYISS